jgi:hypothetical protein
MLKAGSADALFNGSLLPVGSSSSSNAAGSIGLALQPAANSTYVNKYMCRLCQPRAVQ